MSIRSNVIRLAFLGCGFATRLHSKTLRAFSADVECLYASRNPEKAAEYNTRYHGHGSFGTYEDAFHDPSVKVVFIATPPAHHLDLTLRALRAGKDVIVEKPAFLDPSDFVKVRNAQNEVSRRVFVSENYYYKPVAIRLRSLLEADLIGEVKFIHINALKHQEVKDWRGDQSLSGGGALFEGGVHWINFIANLGLKISDVYGFQPDRSNKSDKSMLIVAEFVNGAVGTLSYSWEIPSLLHGLRLSKIYGQSGSISFESNGLFIIVHGKKKSVIFPGIRDIAGYKAMFQDFINALRTGEEPRMTFDLAARDLDLIGRIYNSANEKVSRDEIPSLH